MSTKWETVRRAIGLGLTRYHLRNQRDEVISFTGSVSGARRGLLIMPAEPTEPSVLVPVIRVLKKKFPERGLTVITWGPSLELMQMLPHSQFERVLEEEITRFYLPAKAMLQRIVNVKYDVAIDLNLDLVLPSGYICRESDARVRIGFAGKQSDLFYNFQIKRDPLAARGDVYERLAACLKMF